MRYSRMLNNQPRKKRRFANIFLVLIILGIAAYFICAGAAGSWIASNIIDPVFNNGAAAAATETINLLPGQSAGNSPSSTQPAASVTRAEEEVTAAEISLYALQAGAFSDEGNANNEANIIKAQGGAGYVAYDGNLYRVLVAGYTDKSNADDVKTALEQQNVETTLFNLKSDSLSFKIGAEQSQIDAIKACFNSVPDTVSKLQQIIFDLDNGNSVDSSIQALKQNVAGVYSSFTNTVSSVDGSIKSLSDYMNIYSSLISALPSSASTTTADFSSKLRYALIEIVVDYSSLISQLNG